MTNKRKITKSIWGALTVILALSICVFSMLDRSLQNSLHEKGQELVQTLMYLLIGDVSYKLGTLFNAWFIMACFTGLLTWFAWLTACDTEETRYKSLLPAFYTGALITLMSCFLCYLVSGAFPVLTTVLFLASGVVIALAGIACYWFLWNTFPKVFNKETVRYLIFGVLTTIVNLATFNFCDKWLHFSTALSTTLAWITGVLFAYVTNKLFVFESKTDSAKALIKEASLFFGARFLTYIIDLVCMIVMVDWLHWSGGLSKILDNIIVLVLNYVFSKLFIFTKKETKSE